MFKVKGQVKKEKGFFAKRKLLIAITTLVGTIIGAGILGIPYVVAKAGFWYGSFLILLIGIAFVFLNLFVGEVVLRTNGHHQLTGYAEKYLGKNGKRLMLFAMMINIYGALIAYLIGEGTTFSAIFGFGHPLVYTLIFFVIVSVIISKGIKATGKSELILISLLVLVVILIGIFSFNSMNAENFVGFNPLYAFLPYGVILFAFMASPAMPELNEVLRGKDKKLMKKAIFIGSIVPIVLYLLFVLTVVGVVGLNNFESLADNQRIATVALSVFTYPILGKLANFLAVLSMFTSFLALGLAMVQMYMFDYGFKHRNALLLTLILPLVIVLAGITTFIKVLGFTGAIAGGLDGILVVLMFWKAKKLGDRKPEYSLGKNYLIGSVLILMFSLGIIYVLWSYLF
ncbi:MAG: aromatic amino acid transport family protein [Candidatus Woesearchaeota archaeon]